jgi:hypothetical protein
VNIEKYVERWRCQIQSWDKFLGAWLVTLVRIGRSGSSFGKLPWLNFILGFRRAKVNRKFALLLRSHDHIASFPPLSGK